MINPFSETYWFFVRNINPLDFYRYIVNKLSRLFYGYSKQDLWNVGDRLAEISYLHLKAFKQSKRHGIPVGFSNLSCTCKEHEKEHGQCVSEKCENRARLNWEYSLDKMIEGFRIVKDWDFDIEEDIPHSIFEGERIEHKGGVEFKLSKSKEEQNDIWFKKYRENADLQQKKVKDGMELYSKYIQSLWD